MSGYPNPGDITELRQCLIALKAEEEAVVKASKERSEAQVRLEEAQERVQKYQERIDKLMEKMDVAGPGNFGYKNRLHALLTGLAQT